MSHKFEIKIAVIIVIMATGLYFASKHKSRLNFSYDDNHPIAASIDKTDSEEHTEDRHTLKILIGGDVMFDRNIRKVAQKLGYSSFFSSISNIFQSADISVVNLEGPVTSNTSKTLLPDGHTTGSFTFTFPPESLASLLDAGVDLVSLANNHTDNFGWNGFKETKGYLDEIGIRYFGSPWNSTGTEAVISKNGLSVAFVGYHAFIPGFNNVIGDIIRLDRQNDFVIVMPHWGVEYSETPGEDLRTKARALVEAGADAVIGAHPHVVMSHEWIDGRPIFYSLGNLLFDQYFSPEVMKGNMVELTLEKIGSNTRITNVKIHETSFQSHQVIEITDQYDMELPD